MFLNLLLCHAAVFKDNKLCVQALVTLLEPFIFSESIFLFHTHVSSTSYFLLQKWKTGVTHSVHRIKTGPSYCYCTTALLTSTRVLRLLSQDPARQKGSSGCWFQCRLCSGHFRCQDGRDYLHQAVSSHSVVGHGVMTSAVSLPSGSSSTWLSSTGSSYVVNASAVTCMLVVSHAVERLWGRATGKGCNLWLLCGVLVPLPPCRTILHQQETELGITLKRNAVQFK